MNPPILETVDLRMVYHVGHVEVQALRGVDIQVQKGEFGRASCRERVYACV